MIATLHLIVNPYQRYLEYGPVAGQALAEAMKQDPTNPRHISCRAKHLRTLPNNLVVAAILQSRFCKMRSSYSTLLNQLQTFIQNGDASKHKICWMNANKI
jgi:hypothetical protein